ncbi:hypothetical protein J6590_028152 [Homalodisca vitripennis]|nr:hypothetical protein J6590_028152 [Homalodisca vitripennis]
MNRKRRQSTSEQLVNTDNLTCEPWIRVRESGSKPEDSWFRNALRDQVTENCQGTTQARLRLTSRRRVSQTLSGLMKGLLREFRAEISAPL